MTKSVLDDNPSYLIYPFILLLPFLILYWMVPFVSNLTIGNDYPTFAIQHQMELLFSIKTGAFPLYVPGFGGGHSSSALMMGGIYHPMAYIASILPGYWGGKALQWNTFLRLLSLGLTHLCMFVFLRNLRIKTILSFLLSCITIYNLRMLDLFRYGSSLETHTGFLLLCTAIGGFFIHKRTILGALTITGATYLLITSGHPQMMYYGLLGAGVFSLVIPFFISALRPDLHIDFNTVLRFWITIGLSFILGILLSSNFILPFYFDFLGDNARRVGQDYDWAVSWTHDNFFGALSNFFYPMRSDVHDAFGGSSLFLMAALLPVLKCFRANIPRVVWVVWGLVLFIFLYMLGSLTPVHRLFWEYVPFASSFRIAGRITIIMPIFIMLVLVWVIKAEPFSIRIRGFSVSITPARLLGFAALLAIAVYFSVIYAVKFFAPSSLLLEPTLYTPNSISYKFNGMPVPPWVSNTIILSGIAALILMSLRNTSAGIGKIAGILICMATILQLSCILRYGTWITISQDAPTYESMKEEKKSKLSYRFPPGSGFSSAVVDKHIELSFMEPYLGKIYTQAIPVSNQDEAYVMMTADRSPQQIFIEGYERDIDPAPATQVSSNWQGTVTLEYSSFNRLRFKVVSPAEAFFGLSYPYTGHWKAWVNNQEVHVYRANGAANAIKIPKGESLIEFRYFSTAAFWGMIISSATFTIIGLYVCLSAFGGLKRILSVVIVMVFGIGVFILWETSLYTGENLFTAYTWTYVPAPSVPNLAYSKKTSTNSDQRVNKGNLAIDGDRSPGSGFYFQNENPYLTIDLHNNETIQKIVLYESKHSLSKNTSSFNARPLSIVISQDGEQWREIASVITEINPNDPTNIVFEKHHIARYVRITASGNCFLSFDEVEIYGTDYTK